jgi:hypothetical protein
MSAAPAEEPLDPFHTHPHGGPRTLTQLRDALREITSAGRKGGVRTALGFELDPVSGRQYRTIAELGNAAHGGGLARP